MHTSRKQVKSYTDYLGLVERGEVENVPAPRLAIQYYEMGSNAKLSDLIRHVRADEQQHSEVNHKYANGNTSYKRKTMKFSIAMMLVSILGIGGILYTTIMNAEVSGYTDVQVVGENVMKNILQSMEHSQNN